MKTRFKVIPTVYLFVKNENNEILLLKRANSGFADGMYSLPAGHVDGNETAKQAMVREAQEEVNLNINETDLDLKLTVHRKFEDREYIELFFEVTNFNVNDIKNNEPHKCSELKFYNINNLPDNVINYIKDAVTCYKNNENYLSHGF